MKYFSHVQGLILSIWEGGRGVVFTGYSGTDKVVAYCLSLNTLSYVKESSLDM